MRLVIRADRMINGIADVPAEIVEVEIVDGVVADVRTPCPRHASADIRYIDGRGCTLLPGLIDCHVHICQACTPDPLETYRSESEFATLLRAVRNARETLLAGITTIRNVGSRANLDLELHRAIESGLIYGPRMLASGRVITSTGGHGHYMGVEADTPEEVRKAVRQQLKLGATVIKLMVTGGVMTPGVRPGVPQLGFDEITAAVVEAHRKGVKVCGHAEGREGVNDAIDAGIDSIEHGFFIGDEAAPVRMREKGVVLVPTLMAYWLIAHHGEAAGIPPHAAENARRTVETNQQSFRMALKAGVNIAMGSDAGTAFNFHREGARELRFMVECGMSPMAAVKAATRQAAKLLGLADRLGAIAPGFLADLILVRGDPLEDVGRLVDAATVIKGGMVVKEDGRPLI